MRWQAGSGNGGHEANDIMRVTAGAGSVRRGDDVKEAKSENNIVCHHFVDFSFVYFHQ